MSAAVKYGVCNFKEILWSLETLNEVREVTAKEKLKFKFFRPTLNSKFDTMQRRFDAIPVHQNVCGQKIFEF